MFAGPLNFPLGQALGVVVNVFHRTFKLGAAAFFGRPHLNRTDGAARILTVGVLSML